MTRYWAEPLFTFSASSCFLIWSNYRWIQHCQWSQKAENPGPRRGGQEKSLWFLLLWITVTALLKIWPDAFISGIDTFLDNILQCQYFWTRQYYRVHSVQGSQLQRITDSSVSYKGATVQRKVDSPLQSNTGWASEKANTLTSAFYLWMPNPVLHPILTNKLLFIFSKVRKWPGIQITWGFLFLWETLMTVRELAY